MPQNRCKHALGALTILVAFGGAAAAQDPSGRAVGVIPDASALRVDGRRPLAIQQPVYMGDRIQTGSSGEAQILFIDTTRLVVGPASSLLIDSSVMRNRRTMSSFVVSALRGSFRFITGESPKPAYSIRTPTATIGVRGTQFDFTVLPNGGTEFVLLQGEARICDRFGNCVLAQRACSAISVPPSAPLRAISDQGERNTRLRSYFPYVRNQYASLRQEFRANVGSCGNIAAGLQLPERNPGSGAPAVGGFQGSDPGGGDPPSGGGGSGGGGSGKGGSTGGGGNTGGHSGGGSAKGGDARSGDAKGGDATNSGGGSAAGGSARSGDATGGSATNSSGGGSATGGNARSGDAQGGNATSSNGMN